MSFEDEEHTVIESRAQGAARQEVTVSDAAGEVIASYRSRCRSIEDVVRLLNPYVEEGTLLLPRHPEALAGAELRFTVKLEGGSIALAGHGQVQDHAVEAGRPGQPTALRVVIAALEGDGQALVRRILAAKRLRQAARGATGLQPPPPEPLDDILSLEDPPKLAAPPAPARPAPVATPASREVAPLVAKATAVPAAAPPEARAGSTPGPARLPGPPPGRRATRAMDAVEAKAPGGPLLTATASPVAASPATAPPPREKSPALARTLMAWQGPAGLPVAPPAPAPQPAPPAPEPPAAEARAEADAVASAPTADLPAWMLEKAAATMTAPTAPDPGPPSAAAPRPAAAMSGATAADDLPSLESGVLELVEPTPAPVAPTPPRPRPAEPSGPRVAPSRALPAGLDRLLGRLPPGPRAQVVRFGPLALCSVVSFTLGFVLRGGPAPPVPVSPEPAALASAAAPPPPAEAAEPVPAAEPPAAEAPAAEAAPAAQAAVLVVNSDPPGATLLVDRRRVGRTPKRLELDQGQTVKLIARLDGYRSYSKRITLSEAETVIDIELAAKSGSRAKAKAARAGTKPEPRRTTTAASAGRPERTSRR